ncbi:MAG: CHAT domain-containing protein [Acidobacteriota bacterium]|nr:CHAT domain-containing protein [Acidobacteriota bacterium]
MNTVHRRIYSLTAAFLLMLALSTAVFAQTSDNVEKQERAKGVYDEGLVLSNQGTAKSDQAALEKFQQAKRLYQEINDQSEYHGLSTLSLGMISDRSGKKSEALKYYEEALRFFQDNHFEASEATTLAGIGLVFGSSGETQKSLGYFNQSLAIRKRTGDKSGEAALLSKIGEVYSVFGENQKALDLYDQALLTFRQLGDRYDEAAVLGRIGIAYYVLGENQKALDFYEQALPIKRQLGDRLGEAILLNSIGQTYIKSDVPKALHFYEQALSLYRQLGNRGGEAVVLNNLGFAYNSLGEKQKALDFYSKALSLIKEVGEKGAEARVLLNIARIYSTSGEKQKAAEFYNRSRSLMIQTGDKFGEAKLLGDVMNFWEAQKNSGLAILYGKQAVNIYQELRKNIQGLDREIQKTYLESIEDVYRRFADILIAQGRIAEAEQVLAMLKEEEFFAYLRRSDKVAADLKGKISLSPDEKKAFEDYEKFADNITQTAAEFGALDAKKNALPLGESLAADEQAQYDALKAKYDAAVVVFGKFLNDLKVKFGTNDKRIAVVESDTQGILKRLNEPRTVIISTIVGEDRLNLIVTTGDTQRAHTVDIKAADLNKLVSEFRGAVQNPEVDPRPLGKKLFDKLFPAALQKDLDGIKADTIVWSLDGSLRYVPMAALWDGQKYLAERYTNAVLTLASRDKISAARGDRTKWLALGVGVSKAASVKNDDGSTANFDALAAVPQELCSVIADPKKKDFCGAFGKQKTGVIGGLMLADEDFTLQNFENNVGKVPVIHIASHFSLNAGDESDSYLLLGGGADRRFSLISLKKTRLDKVELLTLSACNTAMTSGANSSGVEIEGFGALAQNQGAKTVLATLWSVADDSTRDLMTEFYRELEDNPQTGKAEALRQSQIKLINGKFKPEQVIEKHRSDAVRFGANADNYPRFTKDENAPFAHPFYWSPFVLIGNWR